MSRKNKDQKNNTPIIKLVSAILNLTVLLLTIIIKLIQPEPKASAREQKLP